MVDPLHFEDLSGTQFEKLVYALVAKMKSWDKLEWMGQVGADGGTDITGSLLGITYRYQCANHKRLVARKVIEDIDKLANSGIKIDHFIVVCGGVISNKARSSIIDYAVSRCNKYAEVWSGAELEEKLRKYGPGIIERFFILAGWFQRATKGKIL